MTSHAYNIAHRLSGNDFGVFVADSPEGALDAMAVEAGYKSHAETPDECRASEDDLIVTNVDGTVEDLATQLRLAAAEFQKSEANGALPTVLYVQMSHEYGWTAEFSQTENREMEMTRWSTGDDVTDLYVAATTEHRDAVFEYAGDILGGWDSDWTDD